VRLGVRAAELSWVVARPDGICPASLPPPFSGRASSPWSTLPGHQPWRRWTVGVQRGVSTHPDVVVRGPAVQSVRCPVRPVSGHLGSSSSVQPSAVRPRPSGRVRLVPRQVVALATRPVRRAPSPQGRVEVPVGGRAVGRLGRWPSKPGGDAAEVARWAVGMSVADPGPGWVRAAARTRRATRRARPACGAPVAGGARAQEQAGGARWARLPHSCRPVLGARPRCVVVVEPAARVGGPERADGRADGDRRAAPARPRLAAAAPGSLPTAL
jgi:hypothetical protein